MSVILSGVAAATLAPLRSFMVYVWLKRRAVWYLEGKVAKFWCWGGKIARALRA